MDRKEENIVKSVFNSPDDREQPGILGKSRNTNFSRISKKWVYSSEKVSESRHPFGLDIGTESIRIVSLSKNRGSESLLLSKGIVEEIPVSLSESGDQLPGAGISGFLRELVEKHKLVRTCFTAMPLDLCKVELLKLPSMPEKEIRDAVKWELANRGVSDIDNMSLDHIKLSPKNKPFLEGQIGVLAVYAHKEKVMKYLRDIGSAGIDVKGIDLRPSACLRAIGYYAGKELKDRVILLLDIDSDRSTLGIVYNGEIMSARVLNFTGDRISSAIREYCKVSGAEADEMKTRYGFSGISPDIKETSFRESLFPAVEGAILPLLEDLTRDIEHTFKHFSYKVTRSFLTGFDGIVLSGDPYLFCGLKEFLEKKFSIEVKIPDPVSYFAGHDPKAIKYPGPSINVALGLAMNGVMK